MVFVAAPLWPLLIEDFFTMVKLTDEQYAVVKDSFTLFDSQQTGQIMVKHVASALEDLGLTLRPKRMVALLTSVIDPMKQRTITLEQFVQIVERRMEETRSTRALGLVFKKMDQGEKGGLTVEDLRVHADQCKDDCSDEDLQAMIDEADLEGNGMVNFKEFAAIISMK